MTFYVNTIKSKAQMRWHSECSVQNKSAHVDKCQTVNRHATSKFLPLLYYSVSISFLRLILPPPISPTSFSFLILPASTPPHSTFLPLILHLLRTLIIPALPHSSSSSFYFSLSSFSLLLHPPPPSPSTFSSYILLLFLLLFLNI